jgi:uncharacterized protein HemX
MDCNTARASAFSASMGTNLNLARDIARPTVHPDTPSWCRTLTGLIIPSSLVDRREPQDGVHPLPTPTAKYWTVMHAFRDWANALGTALSALVAIAALGFAYFVFQDEQRSDEQRRETEQMMLQQSDLQSRLMMQQTKMTQQIAQLEARNTQLQLEQKGQDRTPG